MVLVRFIRRETRQDAKNAAWKAFRQDRCFVWVVAVSALSMFIGRWYTLAKDTVPVPLSNNVVIQTPSSLPRRPTHYKSDVVELCDNTSYVTKSGASIVKATADGLNPTKSGTPQETKHGARLEHDTPHGAKPTGPGANPSSKLA
jgi:hypothetical protein